MGRFYRGYLNSEHWKTFRAYVLETRGKKCEDCGAIDTVFDVHHLTYENLGDEQLEDVVILCHPCHWARHPEKSRSKCPHEITVKSRWESGGSVTFGWSCAKCYNILALREPDEEDIAYAEKIAKKYEIWLERERVKRAIKEVKKKEKDEAKKIRDKDKPKRKSKKRKPYKKREAKSNGQ